MFYRNVYQNKIKTRVFAEVFYNYDLFMVAAAKCVGWFNYDLFMVAAAKCVGWFDHWIQFCSYHQEEIGKVCFKVAYWLQG